MKPNRAAGLAVVILAIAGLAALLAAGLVATKPFKVVVANRRYNCGSVLSPSDPRNRVSRQATIPRVYQIAESRCQKTNSNRTHTATEFLLVGVVPLLIVLILPFLARRSRRARGRRRVRLGRQGG